MFGYFMKTFTEWEPQENWFCLWQKIMKKFTVICTSSYTCSNIASKDPSMFHPVRTAILCVCYEITLSFVNRFRLFFFNEHPGQQWAHLNLKKIYLSSNRSFAADLCFCKIHLFLLWVSSRTEHGHNVFCKKQILFTFLELSLGLIIVTFLGWLLL